MDNSSLRKLQLVELDILKNFIRICNKYELKYYALGGTLLGAVRHKGFIPWDDDIDVGMPRPDYEKFLQIADVELHYPIELATLQNHRTKYNYYYARIVDKRVQLRRTISEESAIINAWIDVFPLDGAPRGINEFNRWYKKIEKLKIIFSFSQFKYFFKVVSDSSEVSNHNRELKTYLKAVILNTGIYKLVKPEKVWAKLDCELKRYDYENADTLINACGFWGVKEKFPKAVYGDGEMYNFEDIFIRGPVDYDYVLKQMYGNYMTPPSDANKNHHGTDNIVFLNV